MLGRPLTVSVSSKVSFFFSACQSSQKSFPGQFVIICQSKSPDEQRQPKPWKIRMKSLPRHFWRSAFNWLWMWNIKASRRAPSTQSRYSWAWVFFLGGANGWLENRESLEDLRYSRGNRVWTWPFSNWKFLYNLPDGHLGVRAGGRQPW